MKNNAVCVHACMCVCAIKYSNDKMIMYCTASIMHLCYIIIFIVIIMYGGSDFTEDGRRAN